MAAELHLHLEGSVDPASVGLPHTLIRDFAQFIEVFKSIVQRLESPEDYARITTGLLHELMKEGIDHAEVTLSAGVILWKKQDLHRTYEAIRRACIGFPNVRVKWCFDAVRQFGVEAAMRVVETAGEFKNDGVVSFGIGGDEIGGPAKLFHEVFARARALGLRLTAHAGETDGPQSVWDAMAIGAERIGHGIRAVEDPGLMRYLREHDIPLEVCITSNVITGAVPSLEVHPVRKLFDAGVPLTLNTDDPGIFDTTLSREFEIARDVFGFSDVELKSIAENAYRYAF
jgi:aminodeoxyfutalosine deaminase